MTLPNTYTPDSLGEFEQLERLGGGAHGDVYRAFQNSMDRWVALKVLRRELAADPTFVERFQREATTCARLEHSGIVPVYAFGHEDSAPYMAMRFIDGGTLDDFMRTQSPTLEEVRRLLQDVGGALDYAHSLDVVHRDVKPANIMRDQHGRYLLMDFGIAKILASDCEMTMNGQTLGTASYMSPEQCQGLDLTGASDLYSLGVVIFALLVGELPFQAENAQSLQLKHIHMAPSFPETGLRGCSTAVSDALIEFLSKSLAKDPSARFETAAEMLRAFDEALEVDTVEGASDGGSSASMQAVATASGQTARAAHASSGNRVTFFASAIAVGIAVGLGALQMFPGEIRAVPTFPPVNPNGPPLPVPVVLPPLATPELPTRDRVVIVLGDGITEHEENGLPDAIRSELVSALRHRASEFAEISVRSLPDSTTDDETTTTVEEPAETANRPATLEERISTFEEDLVIVIDGDIDMQTERATGVLRKRPTFGGDVENRSYAATVQLAMRMFPRHGTGEVESMTAALMSIPAPTPQDAFAKSCAASSSDFSDRLGARLRSWHDGIRDRGRDHCLVLVHTKQNAGARTLIQRMLAHAPWPLQTSRKGVLDLDTVEAESVGRLAESLELSTEKSLDLPPGSQRIAWRFRYPATSDWFEREFTKALQNARPGYYPEVFVRDRVTAFIIR